MFCLLFELHFLIHLVPLMHHYPCSYLLFFPSFFLAHLPIPSKKGESILESIPKSIVISIWLLCTFSMGEIPFLVHILNGRNSISYAYSSGEKVLDKMHIPRKKTFFIRKPCFVLFYFMFVFLLSLWCFELLFSIYALLFLLHCIYVLDMHPYAIVLY